MPKLKLHGDSEDTSFRYRENEGSHKTSALREKDIKLKRDNEPNMGNYAKGYSFISVFNMPF